VGILRSNAVVPDMQSSAALLLLLGCAAGMAGVMLGLRAYAGGGMRLSRRRDLGGRAGRVVGVLTILLSIAFLVYITRTVAEFRRIVREMEERLHPRVPVAEFHPWREEPGPHSPDRPGDAPGVVDRVPGTVARRAAV
jgi:hypothetical protein